MLDALDLNAIVGVAPENLGDSFVRFAWIFQLCRLTNLGYIPYNKRKAISKKYHLVTYISVSSSGSTFYLSQAAYAMRDCIWEEESRKGQVFL